MRYLLKRVRPTTATSTLLSFLIVCLVFSSAAQSPVATGVDSIRAEELREKLSHIASEKFKGRGNGTAELNMAADYIAAGFERSGLTPMGDDGSYYQKFQVYSSRLGPNNSLRVGRSGDANSPALKVRSDFIPELWSVSGEVTGPLQLVEEKAGDGSKLTGKIAVEFEDQVSSNDPEFPANASEGVRLQAAGAIAAIIVQSASSRNSGYIANLAESFREDLPVRLTPMAGLDVPDYPQIPVVVLSADAGRQLVAELHKSQGSVSAILHVDVERRIHSTQNVVGLIEGSDPVLNAEVVVVGAHYDHDGEAFGQIWYGADDNGSGTAALMELAEAFASGSLRPARSVLLSAWAGEEKGLLGSRYYVSHPVFPLNRTVSMFQMDMIGRDEEHPANRAEMVPEEHASENTNSLNALGTAFSPDLRSIISRVNDQVGLKVNFRYDFGAEDLMRRSDQWSFLQKAIPSIFFFAGLHPDYHTPRDTADKINYPKLEKATRLVYLATYAVADQTSKPQFIKATAPAQKAY